MSATTREVPGRVRQAAASVWAKWSGEVAAAASAGHRDEFTFAAMRPDPAAWKTPEERMIDKIRARMREYPEWYEADPERLSATVCRELDRIGERLARVLPYTDGAVEVWTIPLSVFNWLVEEGGRTHFIRGALSAWSDAQDFNSANVAGLDPAERERRRAAFLEIAPPLLKAVLAELTDHCLWISFAQKYVGPEFKALIMRAQCRERPGAA